MRRNRIDTVIDIICLIIFVVSVFTVALVYRSLPQQIPSHFDFRGNIDGYSSKGSVWIMPAVMLFTLLLFFFCERDPKATKNINGFTGKTKTLSARGQRYNMYLLKSVKLIIMVMFFTILLFVIHLHPMPWYLTVIEVVLITGDIIFWMSKIGWNNLV